jgi:Fic family protein
MTSSYIPPYALTSRIVNLVAQITEKLTLMELAKKSDLRLRRINRIQTIQGSLAIEGNSLSTEQVTAILENKPVMGSMKEIQEVRNAITAYEQFEKWDPCAIDDLLQAHKMLTIGLIDECGKFRSGGVGVVAGTNVLHLAPPAERVPYLIADLLDWLQSTDEHPLIASAVFHYEFEYIHPFADGNGRIGRLWQTLILSKWNKQLAHLPVENLIYQEQQTYYDAIKLSTQKTDCAPFIEFILEAIYKAVVNTISTQENTQENTQEKILSAININPKITRIQLAKQLNRTPDSIKHHLQTLTKKGLIKHTGSTKSGEWIIKP